MAVKTRTFGWVQDPGKLNNLRRTVEVFDNQSSTHRELVDQIIPKLVEERDGKDQLIKEMSKDPLWLSYKDLVGTSFNPRADSRCNGIIQAAIKGQKREFIGDWPADNFVRWAHALGFIQYDHSSDSFSITEFGLKYTRSNLGTDDNVQHLPGFEKQESDVSEKDILTQAFLSYPPVMRVLNLLFENEHMTKFEIGRQLGFVGEEGFTSISQNLFVRSFAQAQNSKERNKIRSNWEGSSDKYARMIATWLSDLGWVDREPKLVEVVFGNETYEEEIGHSYVITPAGMEARREGLVINKYKGISKNVFWEMLATKGKDKDYIRTRRALILQEIQRNQCTVEELKQKISNKGFNESETTILDDLEGLKRIGLNIQSAKDGFILRDTIQHLAIPGQSTTDTTKPDVQSLVDNCREYLENIPHDYLVLIPLSFKGPKGSLLFETTTIELLVDQCGFEGLHLGGTNNPDGLIYTQDEVEDYGVIIDTKSYKDGFNIPASERDKMVRYVQENNLRNNSHTSKWWDNFPDSLDIFRFLFVSSKFGGKYKDQLKRISDMTNKTLGAAVTSYNLLLLAEKIKSGKINIQDVSERLSCLTSVEVECCGEEENHGELSLNLD